MSDGIALNERPPLRERIAHEIRMHLFMRDMSAAELARKTGLKQPYVSRRMVGDIAFDVDDLELIAKALDIEVEVLFQQSELGRVVYAAKRGRQTTEPYPAQSKRPHPFVSAPRSPGAIRRPPNARAGRRPSTEVPSLA